MLRILALALLGGVAANSAQAATLVVQHDLASPAELAAVDVLKKVVEAGGDTWVTFQMSRGTSVSFANLIAGGNPPNVFFRTDPGTYRDLNHLGKSLALDDFFSHGAGLEAFNSLPPALQQIVKVDGRQVRAPNSIHVDGTACFNVAIAKKVGVDPTAWKSLDDLYAAYNDIVAKGYIPLAFGADNFQIGYLFHSMVAAVSGGEIYDQIFGEKPNRDALDTPAMRATFDAMRAVQQHTDPGSPNRSWNDTTNLVITGKALMQIQGDWMIGEFRAAGMKQGTDYNCMVIPGAKGIAITANTWGFLDTGDAETTAGELRFAAANFDLTVQHDFALNKGSAPVRLDTPRDGLPPWTLKVLDLLGQDGYAHMNPNLTIDQDWRGAIWDTASKFWADPSMTSEQAIEVLQKSYDQIFF